jgi:hypothetical protein
MKKILLDFILGISLSYSAIITSVVADIILALASEKPHNIHVWDESEQ